MEYNIQKYKFTQNGKDYVVSTGLVGDKIRITCQENLSLDGPFYSNEFSIYDLRVANQFFTITETPEEALQEINNNIERQKSALKPGKNDTMHFIGYLVIGTDNDVYNLILKRDNDVNKYGIFTPPISNAVDLVLPTNYKVDGERLKLAEKNAGDLQREQTFIEDDINMSIPEINKLKKITIDIEEENALIKKRLKILEKQLERRKYNVIRLKQENSNLKRENINLNNYIKNQENSIRNKQTIQLNVKVQERPNINPGISAVTSKFEQKALRTFLSRTGAKPTTENYIENMGYTTTPTQYTQFLTNYNSYGNNIGMTQLQQPQIITQQPIILKIEQPIINLSPQKLLRNSNYSIATNHSYNNPTYPAYLSSNSKEVIYKNKVNTPNNYINLSKNLNNINNVGYNSQMINKNINKDIPYTNDITQNNQSKIIPLGNKLIKSNSSENLYENNKENRIKIDGYGNSMGLSNSSRDIKNGEYNTIMGKAKGNINEEYNKPIGSRLPKVNLGNYTGKQIGIKSSKNSNSSKNQRKDSPEIGYSSYRPDSK